MGLELTFGSSDISVPQKPGLFNAICLGRRPAEDQRNLGHACDMHGGANT
jgi:hypothetical protein